MRKWMLKAAVQRAIGFMPASRTINRILQTRITRSICLRREDFEDHLTRDWKHLRRFAAATGRSVPSSVLEIGTGWHPILPIAMALCGAERVTTFDVAPNGSPERLREAVAEFIAAADDGRLAKLLPGVRADRVEILRAAADRWTTEAEFLGRLGIEARVANADFSGVADGSVDLIVSNVVLEYVGGETMRSMLAECRRVMAADGAMSHDISMQDQYSFFDAGLPRLNFLRYSDRMWGLINNPLIPLTRLRSPDYVRLFGDAGFEVTIEPTVLAEEGEITAVPLAERFRAYAMEDLRILRAVYVATHRAARKLTAVVFGTTFQLMMCGAAA